MNTYGLDNKINIKRLIIGILILFGIMFIIGGSMELYLTYKEKRTHDYIVSINNEIVTSIKEDYTVQGECLSQWEKYEHKYDYYGTLYSAYSDMKIDKELFASIDDMSERDLSYYALLDFDLSDYYGKRIYIYIHYVSMNINGEFKNVRIKTYYDDDKYLGRLIIDTSKDDSENMEGVYNSKLQ